MTIYGDCVSSPFFVRKTQNMFEFLCDICAFSSPFISIVVFKEDRQDDILIYSTVAYFSLSSGDG